MDLAAVMDEIAATLDTITGLRVNSFPAGKIQVPAAIVAWPDRIDFDETYGRGSDRITLPVLLLVSGASQRAAKAALGKYCNGHGPASIKQVLEAATHTAFDSVRVTGVDFGDYQNGAVTYPTAIFSLDIVGSG